MSGDLWINDYAIEPTGIDELDAILEGGLPQGYSILLAGDSGTGKTVMSMQWLYEGVKQDKRGLYLTLTESVTEATKNLQSMSFYDETESGVRFADLRSTFDILDMRGRGVSQEDIDDLIDAIGSIVEDAGADRIVIDSITAIAQMMDDEEQIRTFMFEIGQLLSSLDATVILTSEVSGNGYSAYGVEEFISDGIIKLQHTVRNDDIERKLRVVKLRGTSFDTGVFDFAITGDGITIFDNRWNIDYSIKQERISLGIDGLESLKGDGVRRGTVNLITGPSGAGKTLSSLHFMGKGVDNGEECIFFSLEQSEEDLKATAAMFGGCPGQGEQENMTWCCHAPGEYTPEGFINHMKEAVAENDADRLVIDSVTPLRDQIGNQDVFAQYIQKLLLNVRSENVTTVVTSSHQSLVGTDSVTRGGLVSFVDNVFLLDTERVHNKQVRTFAVWKLRHDDFDHTIYRYDITEDGLQIREPFNRYEKTRNFIGF
ncbi:MAG: ATPase domain-containing protein [Candidatus Nanohaloarchaea archaeon]|nr:ATPase domain-containing protein [Candidatus Nanohaloarchaea archaeon]